MSVKVEIDTKGLERGLDKWLRQKKIATRQALDAVALEVRNQALLRVPIDTGILKTSIHIYNPGSKDLHREVGSKLPYANYIESATPVGTGPHGGPKPYLLPALEVGKKNFPKALKKAYSLR